MNPIERREAMRPKATQNPESVVKEIKRNTRRKFNSEEKIRIILEGLRGEDSIANICRKEGIAPSIYYKWSKAFLEAGKRQLNGDTIREASSNEVSNLRNENEQLKQLVAELSLKNRVLKKSLSGLE
jgi:transposase